jgi:hypothetical protein
MLLPQEIAQQMSIPEYTKLCSDIEGLYHQKFGVISIDRVPESDNLKRYCKVVIELENNIQHTMAVRV